MRINSQATTSHLTVGAVLAALSPVSLIIRLSTAAGIFPLLTFLFGVWGGVELGRYLEYCLGKKNFLSD